MSGFAFAAAVKIIVSIGGAGDEECGDCEKE